MILDNSSYLGMFRGWYFYMCILSDQTTGSRISLFTSWKEQLRNISLSFREILVGILSRSAGGAGGYNVSSPAKRMVYQWPFQEPQLEVPPIYKAYFSGLNFRGYIPLKYCDIYGTNVPPWNRILNSHSSHILPISMLIGFSMRKTIHLRHQKISDTSTWIIGWRIGLTHPCSIQM